MDAWASSADEGRGTLRKAPVRRVQPQAAGDVRMGKPAGGYTSALREEREPGELKHLSNPRKREYSVSSGERKRSSPNRQLAVGVGGQTEASQPQVERRGKADQRG